MDFSQNLCNIMKAHGISKAKLARQLGVSPSTITNWLEGRCKPGIEKMREMCKFFQVTADYLLTGRTEPADYSGETAHSLTPQSFSMALCEVPKPHRKDCVKSPANFPQETFFLEGFRVQ